jgi:hypothetical protein
MDSPKDDDIDARIRALKSEAEARSGGRMRSFVSPDVPADVQEQFWKRVLAAEDDAPTVVPFDELVRSGLALPPPDELDDAKLTVKLWEVIDAMADLGLVLEFTDHLSDRELYVRLWRDILREPEALDPADAARTWHIDMIGTGSEEDTRNWLRYYADDETRRDWARDWPDFAMPERAPLPFDRDRHLP